MLLFSGEHTGPIWCTKFSGCGRLLATAGQDHMLRVWVLKQAFNYFLDIRTKCNADIKVQYFMLWMLWLYYLIDWELQTEIKYSNPFFIWMFHIQTFSISRYDTLVQFHICNYMSVSRHLATTWLVGVAFTQNQASLHTQKESLL